ncbi:hypothetical protein B7992_09695 [Fibrobacter sp. UWH1]|nr:hypothetical protein B7992_09695 [Fibrobacter sp. UWH1]
MEEHYGTAVVPARVRHPKVKTSVKGNVGKTSSWITAALRNEERPQLRPLPATPFEVAEWKTSTVQFNYHIVLDGMYYSVPYQYIKKQVESRKAEPILHGKIPYARQPPGIPGMGRRTVPPLGHRGG